MLYKVLHKIYIFSASEDNCFQMTDKGNIFDIIRVFIIRKRRPGRSGAFNNT